MVHHSSYRGNYIIALLFGIVALLMGAFLYQYNSGKSVDVQAKVVEGYGVEDTSDSANKEVLVMYRYEGEDYFKKIEVKGTVPQVGEYITIAHKGESNIDFDTWKGILIVSCVGGACFYAGLRGLILAKKEMEY